MLVDLLLVYIIVYRLLLLIRGTRAVQILTGIGMVSLAYFLSDRLKLSVVNYLLKQFFDYVFLIVVIIFQDEIRRALANVGRNPFLSGSTHRGELALAIEEVIKSCQILAAKRTGALIVFERQHGLKNYMEGSTVLEAKVSAELLIAIFQPSSPIHDGAAIIRGTKITAAGCFFPLSTERDMDKNLGTRHRAALAVSEETDATALIVSEERGEISFVESGTISRGLSMDELRRKMFVSFDLFVPEDETHGK